MDKNSDVKEKKSKNEMYKQKFIYNIFQDNDKRNNFKWQSY